METPSKLKIISSLYEAGKFYTTDVAIINSFQTNHESWKGKGKRKKRMSVKL